MWLEKIVVSSIVLVNKMKKIDLKIQEKGGEKR